MVNSFFGLSKEDQNKIINTATYQIGLSPTIIEKDLWVCWTLKELFAMDLPVPMGFKGGTSLSKVYNLIQRFSEDIDVTFDYRTFKKLDLPIVSYTKSFLKKLGEELKKFVHDIIYQSILPKFNEITERSTEGTNLSEVKFEVNENGDSIRIYYPSVFLEANNYLTNSILLEFGARNITEPNETHIVKPFLADHIKDFKLPEAKINVLSPLKTFWEKATLIHVECHRGRIGQHADRYSRHWYDLAKLYESPIATRALADTGLMLEVIKHKQAFFNASYANYEKCLNKQFKLIPTESELVALKRDFIAMIKSGMFYGEEPSFNDVINKLRELETKLNV